MKRRLGKPQFVKWLKDNNLYDQHESAANMRKMQAVWKKCQEQRPIMLKGGPENGKAYPYSGEELTISDNTSDSATRSTRGVRYSFYKFNGSIYEFHAWL